MDPAANTIAMANPEKDLKILNSSEIANFEISGIKNADFTLEAGIIPYFSVVAATEESRNQFAAGCVDLYSPMDLTEWIWTGNVLCPEDRQGNINSPEDKRNFTLLLSAIRNQLNAQTQRDGKNIISP